MLSNSAGNLRAYYVNLKSSRNFRRVYGVYGVYRFGTTLYKKCWWVPFHFLSMLDDCSTPVSAQSQLTVVRDKIVSVTRHSNIFYAVNFTAPGWCFAISIKWGNLLIQQPSWHRQPYFLIRFGTFQFPNNFYRN